MHTVLENPETVVTIGYINHRGEISVREIIPKEFGWGSNDYYPTPQFLLDAYDLGKREHRTFALNNILFWKGNRNVIGTNQVIPAESSETSPEDLRNLLSRGDSGSGA